ncbi:TIM barrel protein, partial [Falsiroseomonas oryzae]|uniref:TIM barrel protein n=1 Tax=Falsiroseomonas oryzae TaxID=2766473 RepID=UPI0022EA8F5D
EQAALDARLLAAAQELDAPVNVILGGVLHGAAHGAPPSLREARRRTAEGFAALARRAGALGVRLAVEPIHPAAIGTRSCINQLDQALALIGDDPRCGLTLDLFHSWWDPALERVVAGHPDRLFLVQICGLDILADGGPPRRADLATGPADLALLLRDLDAARYRGPLEYEVFHDAMGRPDPDALLDRAVRDFLSLRGA